MRTCSTSNETAASGHSSSLRNLGVFCLGWLFCSIAAGQLTVSDNQRLREDDFDVSLFEAGNEFGHALAICDFDGDGFQDLAIGSPYADFLGVLDDAGAVHVAYGGPGGLTLVGHDTLTQLSTGTNPPEADDQFGSSLAAGDFTGDGRCDLAVGSPAEDLGAATNAGSVEIFVGSISGLDEPLQVWTQDSTGVQGSAVSFDRFGDVLVAGDFDGDGFDDLAITAIEQGGVVHVLFGAAMGITAVGSDFIYQGDPLGTIGTQSGGDRFGYALASGYFNDDPYADLAVGVPGEDQGALVDVGWIQVFYGQDSGFDDRIQEVHDQLSFGEPVEDGDWFGASLAAGDFDGDALDDLAIGSINEDVATEGLGLSDAGNVAVLYATPTGFSTLGSQVFTQDSPGVSDNAGTAEQFGAALATGDFDADGFDDLAIGVPGESFEGGGLVRNGAVHALYGSLDGLSTAREQFHGQGGWNVGAAENQDRFGMPMCSGDFDDDGASSLVVGVPLENLSGEMDTGLVAVITGIDGTIFDDGFESGDLTAWTAAVP